MLTKKYTLRKLKYAITIKKLLKVSKNNVLSLTYIVRECIIDKVGFDRRRVCLFLCD